MSPEAVDDTGDPPAPDGLTTDQRRRMLRRALASALRAGRHERLVAADAATVQRQLPAIGALVFVLALFWGPAATIADQLALSWPWWPILTVGLVIVVAVVAAAVSLNVLMAGIFFVYFVGLGVEIDQHGNLWATYGIPVIASLAFALLTSTITIRSARDLAVAAAAFGRSAPLLAPLALVVLVIPAFSADLWQAAGRLGPGDVLMLVGVTAVPLFAIVGRQLNAQLPEVLEHRAAGLAIDDGRGELTLTLLKDRLARKPYNLIEFTCSQEVAGTWPPGAAEYASLVAASEGDALKRAVWARLGLCVLVVAVALTGYLYVILATVIDPHVAHAWANEHVPTWDIHVAGGDVHLPGGVYLRVVGLLGALATATFLAFALLEDRFSTALGDALLRLPADRLLALAVPYLALREERVASDDDEFDEWDPGALTPPDQSLPPAPTPATAPS